MNAPTVRTRRLHLRLLNADDRAEFVRVMQVSRELHAPWIPTRPRDESLDAWFDEQLDRVTQGAQSGTEYRFVGVLSDGRIAGFFNLSQIVRRAFESAIAAWSISADVARQGLATEGVAGLLDAALASPPLGLGLHRVAAAVIPENTASIRVAEKNGFRREGLATKYLRINDRWQDHVLFAKLAEEHVLRFIHRA